MSVCFRDSQVQFKSSVPAHSPSSPQVNMASSLVEEPASASVKAMSGGHDKDVYLTVKAVKVKHLHDVCVRVLTF